MPGVNPSLPHSESYLCTGVQVSLDKVLYITGFQPDAEKSTVHHMMVVGCDSPVDIEPGEPNLWNCGGSLGEAGLRSPGSACPGSKSSQTLFMWSLAAGK
ncbi:peptidylglycine alpha-hydroxylating monooxygenase-like [Eurytemora carolleeae]|uniref:peptidylglycine alpha-hydroxylating monooxygenase-like n=1 Tax=Eurytemora carolleeae TaxID=1294199 RepID=UPI000C7737F2|nr:peptidylglycine alpha-hydroxylating monooxygenase-like [Eurytemora carolleeae]|eukprot:XP_023321000.1 peptidylglycine alpha-hydroxylating monooxygenase-like [Eurytemora affinis]